MRGEKGNALFLILIAVALFAALSYAITTSGRGSGTVNKEQNSLSRAQITQYAGELSQAAMRMKIVGGCTDQQISFDNTSQTSVRGDGSAYDYSNPFSPVDGSCNIFAKTGGGVLPKKIPSALVIGAASCGSGCLAPTSWLVSPTRVLGVGSDTGAAGTDLVMWMGRLTREQCLAVNTSLGITNPAGEPPNETFDCQGPAFQGVYPACVDPIGDGAAALAGQMDFCFDWGGAATGDGYLYMHVILAR